MALAITIRTDWVATSAAIAERIALLIAADPADIKVCRGSGLHADVYLPDGSYLAVYDGERLTEAAITARRRA